VKSLWTVFFSWSKRLFEKGKYENPYVPGNRTGRDSSGTGANKGNEGSKGGKRRGSERRGEVVGAVRSAHSLALFSVHRSIHPRRSSCSDREVSKRASGGREERGAGKSGEGEG
jgi:hypothetical protein